MASYSDYDYGVYDDDYVYEDAAPEETEPVDESGYRNTWEILTWIIIALTIILNLILIGILVLRRNLHSIVNKSENFNFQLLQILSLSNFQTFVWKFAILRLNIYSIQVKIKCQTFTQKIDETLWNI